MTGWYCTSSPVAAANRLATVEYSRFSFSGSWSGIADIFSGPAVLAAPPELLPVEVCELATGGQDGGGQGAEKKAPAGGAVHVGVLV